MLKIYVIEQYFSNFNIIMNHLGEFVKNVAYDSVSFRFTFQASSQVMLRLMAHVPNSE